MRVSIISNLRQYQSALSRLKDLNVGFDMHNIVAPDLMHEFELGVWKSVFAQLIRLVAAIDPGKLNEIDVR